MDYLKKFEIWKTDRVFDEETRGELEALDEIADKKEIEDRFYQDLEFGTAGLRGIMGAGTNRMNKYTVGKATMGLGRYLLDTFGDELCKTRGVAVAYDTRNNSLKFAEVTANVLSGLGILVYMHTNPSPIPVLSYSVRNLKTLAGVVVTASHNPKEYNGYKVYDETGCQLIPELAERVTNCVNSVKNFEEIDFSGNPSLIKKIDITDEFVDVILKESLFGDKAAKSALKLIYTPLHGTGLNPVTKALERDGFKVNVLKSQAVQDGNFPTVVSPNPEDRRALSLGIEEAEKTGADIVIGTDPDCDRVGVAVKTKEGYLLLKGNQIGALLADFVIGHTDLSKLNRPVIIKSLVTSAFGSEIAKKHGVSVIQTLTGFKFIGERMTQFEEAKISGNKAQDYDFLFGYEESYGYLKGKHARDKDGVVSSMLIAEMAAEYKAKGKTLFDRLDELYAEVGYFLDTQQSFTLEGKDGLEKIAGMMKTLRTSASPFKNTAKMTDYKVSVPAEQGFGMLPTADMIIYTLTDGSWVAVRPSGTEPKIKIYYSLKAVDKESAEARYETVKNEIMSVLGL